MMQWCTNCKFSQNKFASRYSTQSYIYTRHVFIAHLPFQTHDPTQPTKTQIFDPFPTQPNPTRGSTQPTDNSAVDRDRVCLLNAYAVTLPLPFISETNSASVLCVYFTTLAHAHVSCFLKSKYRCIEYWVSSIPDTFYIDIRYFDTYRFTSWRNELEQWTVKHTAFWGKIRRRKCCNVLPPEVLCDVQMLNFLWFFRVWLSVAVQVTDSTGSSLTRTQRQKPALTRPKKLD